MYAELSNKLKGILRLESSPIAIAFSTEPPEGVEQLKGRMRLCQMLDKVRLDGESFYTVYENHECDGGAYSCGMITPSERLKTGEFLARDLGLFGSTRAARRFISSIPRIEPETVKVVSFSPLESATFEPDIVVLICNAKQGMKIAEAAAYESGKNTLGLTGPPICSAVVAYPFLSGEVVYSLGDMGARRSMKLKDEDIFVAIPAELLPEIVANLGKLR
ncbi:MAG: DUF169 domain-containing protein [Methanomicrobia archaeon]|nr:DUF169 domain-containing protein [Methanomicrobia archaeon]